MPSYVTLRSHTVMLRLHLPLCAEMSNTYEASAVFVGWVLGCGGRMSSPPRRSMTRAMGLFAWWKPQAMRMVTLILLSDASDRLSVSLPGFFRTVYLTPRMRLTDFSSPSRRCASTATRTGRTCGSTSSRTSAPSAGCHHARLSRHGVLGTAKAVFEEWGGAAFRGICRPSGVTSSGCPG